MQHKGKIIDDVNPFIGFASAKNQDDFVKENQKMFDDKLLTLITGKNMDQNGVRFKKSELILDDDNPGSVRDYGSFDWVKDVTKEHETEKVRVETKKLDDEYAKWEKKTAEIEKLSDSAKGYDSMIQTQSKDIIQSMERAGKKFSESEVNTIAENISKKLRPPSGMKDDDFVSVVKYKLMTIADGQRQSYMDKTRAEKMKELGEGSKMYYDKGDVQRFKIIATYEGMPAGEISELEDDIEGA